MEIEDDVEPDELDDILVSTPDEEIEEADYEDLRSAAKVVDGVSGVDDAETIAEALIERKRRLEEEREMVTKRYASLTGSHTPIVVENEDAEDGVDVLAPNEGETVELESSKVLNEDELEATNSVRIEEVEGNATGGDGEA